MLKQVEKLAVCKRCGSGQVAWLKSKAGKWYLADAYTSDRGSTIVAGGLHRCTTQTQRGANDG